MRIDTIPTPAPNPKHHYLVNRDTAHAIRHNGKTMCTNDTYPDAYLVAQQVWNSHGYKVCAKCKKTMPDG